MKLDKHFSNMKLKQLLSENVLGALPSSKLMKMKWNPVTGKKSAVNEASLKSNIMQKWDTTQVIEKDLVEFINSAQDASGSELTSKVYIALKNATEHARRVMRKG